jgi:hypothetical protein
MASFEQRFLLDGSPRWRYKVFTRRVGGKRKFICGTAPTLEEAKERATLIEAEKERTIPRILWESRRMEAIVVQGKLETLRQEYGSAALLDGTRIGHIYLAEAPTLRYFKVGHSINVKSRLYNLRQTVPDKLILRGSWLASFREEKLLHEQLDLLRVAENEWYHPEVVPLLEEHFEALEKQYDRPMLVKMRNSNG